MCDVWMSGVETVLVLVEPVQPCADQLQSRSGFRKAVDCKLIENAMLD